MSLFKQIEMLFEKKKQIEIELFKDENNTILKRQLRNIIYQIEEKRNGRRQTCR